MNKYIPSLLLLLMGSYSLIHSQEGQFNNSFIRRFGPDSAAYNSPLYFSTKKMTGKNKPRKHKKSYRDEIRKNIARSYGSKKLKAVDKKEKIVESGHKKEASANIT